jgi:hypothetical protein
MFTGWFSVLNQPWQVNEMFMSLSSCLTSIKASGIEKSSTSVYWAVSFYVLRRTLSELFQGPDFQLTPSANEAKPDAISLSCKMSRTLSLDKSWLISIVKERLLRQKHRMKWLGGSQMTWRVPARTNWSNSNWESLTQVQLTQKRKPKQCQICLRLYDHLFTSQVLFNPWGHSTPFIVVSCPGSANWVGLRAKEALKGCNDKGKDPFELLSLSSLLSPCHKQKLLRLLNPRRHLRTSPQWKYVNSWILHKPKRFFFPQLAFGACESNDCAKYFNFSRVSPKELIQERQKTIFAWNLEGWSLMA